jgi:polyphosphate glucokinase
MDSLNNNELKVFPDAECLFKAAAEDFYSTIDNISKEKKFFSVVLSGGKTPIALFDLLAKHHYRKKVNWERILFFFSDERYVPATDAASNFHMAHEYLFSKLSIPEKNIFPIPTHFKDPNDAAVRYEHTLREVFQLNADEFPEFDLCYLGLGEDAHTASLMPSSDVIKQYANGQQPHSLTATAWFPLGNMYRITLTPPAINHAKKIVFLVEGKQKAQAVNHVFLSPKELIKYPGQSIHSLHGQTFWYLDQASAKQIIHQLPEQKPLTLGIDIGGTALKMMVIDTYRNPLSEYLIKPTPHPATADLILKEIAEMIHLLNRSFDRVSAGFPGVIKQGLIQTAPNLDSSWHGFNLQKELEKMTGKPARVGNDADVQGFGDVRGEGVELVITLGTGMGSALFTDGQLVPNLELAHHPFLDNKTYEELLGKHALDTLGLEKWNENLKLAIPLWAQTFNYDYLYIGGGNTHNVNFTLPTNTTLSKNIEGVLGGTALWQDDY